MEFAIGASVGDFLRSPHLPKRRESGAEQKASFIHSLIMRPFTAQSGDMDPHMLFAQAQTFRVERRPTWQGPLARGGPRQPLPSKSTPPTPVSAGRVQPSVGSSSSLWPKIAAAAGGGKQGEIVVRIMQRDILLMADRMSLDEIELAASE